MCILYSKYYMLNNVQLQFMNKFSFIVIIIIIIIVYYSILLCLVVHDHAQIRHRSHETYFFSLNILFTLNKIDIPMLYC